MITLYHSPASRSSTFIWLLEELGIDYSIVYCDIKRRSGKGSPDPRNIHPEKRVPALLHDDRLVTEQMAIALYLTDAFPEAGLGRAVGTAERASYLIWLAFFAGEADPVYNARLLYGSNLDPMTLRDHSRVVGRVDAALSSSPFLMGNALTAADILMSGPFEWDPQMAPGNERIQSWLKRLSSRPAAKRAAEKDERPRPSDGPEQLPPDA
jgi:glutathione S-transferase